MRKISIFGLILVVAMMLAACQPTANQTVTDGNTNTAANDNGSPTTGIPQNDSETAENTNAANTNDTNSNQSGQAGSTNDNSQANTNTNNANSNQSGQAGSTNDNSQANTNTNTNSNSNDTIGSTIPKSDAEAGVATGQPTSYSVMDRALVDAGMVELGRIVDLVVDLDTNQVAYVIVQQAGALQADPRFVAVPWYLVENVTAQDVSNAAMALKVQAEALAAAPVIQDFGSFNPGNTGWDDETWMYWESVGNEAGLRSNQRVKVGQSARLTELMNAKLIAANLGEVGSVQNVVVNPVTGHMEYILLKPGEMFNMGNRVIPIPVSAINVNMDDLTNVLVNIDPLVLANAPNFDLGELQNLDGSWESGVQDFWDNQ